MVHSREPPETSVSSFLAIFSNCSVHKSEPPKRRARHTARLRLPVYVDADGVSVGVQHGSGRVAAGKNTSCVIQGLRLYSGTGDVWQLKAGYDQVVQKCGVFSTKSDIFII